MTEIDTGICYIDNISSISKIAYYIFKVVPRSMIWTWSGRTTVLYDSIVKFHIREWRLISLLTHSNFIKKVHIERPILSGIIRLM